LVLFVAEACCAAIAALSMDSSLSRRSSGSRRFTSLHSVCVTRAFNIELANGWGQRGGASADSQAANSSVSSCSLTDFFQRRREPRTELQHRTYSQVSSEIHGLLGVLDCRSKVSQAVDKMLVARSEVALSSCMHWST